MVNGETTSLIEKLKRAEEAESEVQRLGPLASDAPLLREELANTQRNHERKRTKSGAMDRAKQEVKLASDKQSQVAHRLEAVCTLVHSLYSLFKEIDEHRKEASQSLSIADQVDYEEDLEKTGNEEEAMGRDPKSIEFLVASRHGTGRIAQMIEDIDPGFDFLRGCEVSDPMRRDVGNFILGHVISPNRINNLKPTEQTDSNSSE
jgi:GTP1/Obg family GTP-binding protein